MVPFVGTFPGVFSFKPLWFGANTGMRAVPFPMSTRTVSALSLFPATAVVSFMSFATYSRGLDGASPGRIGAVRAAFSSCTWWFSVLNGGLSSVLCFFSHGGTGNTVGGHPSSLGSESLWLGSFSFVCTYDGSRGPCFFDSSSAWLLCYEDKFLGRSFVRMCSAGLCVGGGPGVFILFAFSGSGVALKVG